MNTRFIKMLVLAICFSSSSVNAALITFTDRASFEAALATSVLEDFESLGTTSTSQNLGTSVSFGDVTIANPGNVWATAGFGATTVQVGDQNNRDTLLTLAPGYNALGMDMGLLFSGGTINVILKDVLNNTLLSQGLSVTDNNNLGTASTTFFGFISDSADLQSLTLLSGGFPTIDNLIIGTTEKIPEPGMLSLFAMGLFFLRRFKMSDKV